ncbi:MAG: hypothetical protein QNJ47_27115 [Nostocaceae cyanobacterium]|nr:hypothetical protein [Nostocaceae cyanobacterium]
MKHKKVVRVTATEFELDDGTVFEHLVELEEIPTPQEFQAYYDHWFSIFSEMTDEREVTEDKSSLQVA